MQAKTMKPVVASMGDVAASGGYYVAAAATTIFSNQNTITGSIGVISGWPVIKRLLDKVDITSDSIEPIPNAAWRHMELGLPESEMEKLRRHTDQMYESFKKVVSTGRGMSMEQVEDIAQGQVFTGAQAHELGLVNDLGGLTHAISWAIANAFPINPDNVRQFLDESTWDQVKDAQTGGEAWQEIVRKSIIASSGISDPDPETIRKIVKRCTIRCPPVVETIVIPHTNPVGEALSVALSSAFQNDDERSPIPVDLPVINPGDPGDSSFNTFSSGRVIFGSLLGIALSNNIPLWQFPVFCSWYLAQAAGKMGTEGLGSGFLNNWLGKLLTDQDVFKATEQPRHVFAEKKTAWDVRMEMPPFQIFF
jgi:signal peptide peptidase SppA